MPADIVFDVDAATEKFTSRMSSLMEIVGPVGVLVAGVRGATQQFEEFDKQAQAANITIEQMLGLTRQTTDAYRDFDKATTNLSQGVRKAFGRELIEVMEPTVGFLRDVANEFNNVRNLGFVGAAKLQLQTGFGVGKAVIRVTDEEARLKAAIEDKRIELIQQEAAKARQEIETRTNERLSRLNRRTQTSRQRIDEDAGQRQQFNRFDDFVFDRSQDIRRNAFIARQNLDTSDRRGTPLDVFRERQKLQLAKFDIGQRSQEDIRNLREQSEAAKATIRMAKDIERLTKAFETQRSDLIQERTRAVEASDTKILEKI